MIYNREIGTECYCVDTVKLPDDSYDIEITKLKIQYIGQDKFIPEGFKLLTAPEVSYESVYSSLENAVEHARIYFAPGAQIDTIYLGRDNWRIKECKGA